MITIEKLTEASEQALGEINRLLPQLREDPSELGSLQDLQAIVGDQNVALIAARDDGKVIGMATLYMITKFGKRTGTVEDVVVDNAYRGQGLGEKIMRGVIEEARTEGLKTLYLTSRPERVAGNKLYQKLGFEVKQTNPYLLRL